MIRIISKVCSAGQRRTEAGSINGTACPLARQTHSAEQKLVTQAVIAARKRANVSQAELGKRLNRPQPFISLIESGERRVDVIQFYAIMRALGIDPEEAFRDLIAQLPPTLDI